MARVRVARARQLQRSCPSQRAAKGISARERQRLARPGLRTSFRRRLCSWPSTGAGGHFTGLLAVGKAEPARAVMGVGSAECLEKDDSLIEELWVKANVRPSWPPAFSLGETANGRGVVVRSSVREGQSVQQGDVVASISLDHAAVADEATVGICSDTHLALVLLNKMRDPLSLFYAGYSQMLPATVDSASLWTEKELRELQCEEIAESARSVREHFDVQYEELQFLSQEDFVDLASTVTRKEFQWAMSMVHSRSFCVRANGRVLRCIVPFADMFNHNTVCSQANATLDWRAREDPGSSEALSFELTAKASFSAADEMLISYGPKKNADLLIEYGFVPPVNSWDRAVLYNSGRDLFDDDLHVPEDSLKVLLEKEDMVSAAVPAMSYLTSRPGGSCGSICGLLRIMYADPRVLPFLTQVDSDEGVLVYQWNETAEQHLAKSTELGLLVARAESDAMAHVVRRCTELLADFPTTLDEDMQIASRLENSAANGQMTPSEERLQHAVQLRMGTKQILHQTVKTHARP